MASKWWTLLAVCAAAFMLLLDVTIVVVALPAIQHGLHSSYTEVQWVVDAYALTLGSLLLTAGSLSDRYGHRRLFVVGLTIFTVGSFLCGVAQWPIMLICSRCLQGTGGAIMFATSLALLARTFHGKERGVAFAVWGTITGIATALGPILGGVITSAIGWRGIFFVNIPIGAVAIAVSLWQINVPRPPRASRPDWLGFAALTAALVSLVYGLIRAGETSWGDTVVVLCLCLAAGLLGVFVIAEGRATDPMFDLTLVRTPTFLGGLIAAFTMNGSLFAALVYLVLYIQDDLGYSSLATGERLLLISGATLLPRIIVGRLTSRVSVRWFIGPGLALVGIGLLLMSGLDGTSSWTHLIPGFVIAGIGSGLVNPPLASTAVGVVPPQRFGMASGVNTTFRQIGLATSVAALGSIFAASLHHGIDRTLSSIPSLAGRGSGVVAAIRGGADPGHVVDAIPAGLRGELTAAIHSSFASAMNDLLIVSGLLAIVGAACSVVLIRGKDFAAAARGPGDGEQDGSRSPPPLATGPLGRAHSEPGPPAGHDTGRDRVGADAAATARPALGQRVG
jgi:EmrB/QacA subfamily drug resistance transporter